MKLSKRKIEWRKTLFALAAVVAILSLVLAACAPADDGLSGGAGGGGYGGGNGGGDGGGSGGGLSHGVVLGGNARSET